MIDSHFPKYLPRKYGSVVQVLWVGESSRVKSKRLFRDIMRFRSSKPTVVDDMRSTPREIRPGGERAEIVVVE